MRLTLTLAAAALAGAASAATSDTFLDLRVAPELVPGVKHAELSNGGASEDTDKKSGFGVEVGVQDGQFVNENWGWVAGANLFYQGAKGDRKVGSGDVKFNAYGVDVDAGAAWRLNKQFHLELTPFIGLGASQAKLEVPGISKSGSGLFLDYGLKLGAFYTYEDHWQGGVFVGWEGYRAKGKTDYLSSGSDQTLTLKGNGLLAGISLGYRF